MSCKTKCDAAGCHLALFFILFMAIILNPAEADADISRMIIIGDSRTEEMHEAVGDAGAIWSFQAGGGYEWMESEGIPALEEWIEDGTAVIINLGMSDVLDTSLISAYASYLNRKADEWKELGAVTYYAAVTPVDDTLDHNEQNSDIEYWNNTIRDLLHSDVIFVDLYSAIGTSYTTVDGRYYNYDTYRQIYDFMAAAVYAYQSSMALNEANAREETDASVLPDMTLTAADTEDSDSDEAETYTWEEREGSLYCLTGTGETLTGTHFIGNMICVFSYDGKLLFSRRQ